MKPMFEVTKQIWPENLIGMKPTCGAKNTITHKCYFIMNKKETLPRLEFTLVST
jgi:hypothetical protein